MKLRLKSFLKSDQGREYTIDNATDTLTWQ